VSETSLASPDVDAPLLEGDLIPDPDPRLGEAREVILHGHRVQCTIAGSGPVIGLIHGIASTSESWREVVPLLAERYTVVTSDLIGHGRSAKPRGDYSLGAYASGIRDLLAVLGFERGTVVGHSLGGGIAMQFAYMYPEYTERMVLVSSGGLGREVNPLLRAATLPGSELVLPLLAQDWIRSAGEWVAASAGRVGLKLASDLAEFTRSWASLGDAEARSAFLHTVRGVIDLHGQRVSAMDRLYLAEQLPTMIVWGSSDPVIPVSHGREARRQIPGCRYLELEGAGHWPMLDQPERFARELTDFVESTEPYRFSIEAVRESMRRGASTDAG
jgi:pimeloyl-ACP methyl ester carboxylesterase